MWVTDVTNTELFFFYRGLNDKESRTSFNHIINIGAKNVYRIFAGGNHSWVVIDDIIPIRKRYRAPSPVPDNKTMTVYDSRGNLKQSQGLTQSTSMGVKMNQNNTNNSRQLPPVDLNIDRPPNN